MEGGIQAGYSKKSLGGSVLGQLDWISGHRGDETLGICRGS